MIKVEKRQLICSLSKKLTTLLANSLNFSFRASRGHRGLFTFFVLVSLHLRNLAFRSELSYKSQQMSAHMLVLEKVDNPFGKFAQLFLSGLSGTWRLTKGAALKSVVFTMDPAQPRYSLIWRSVTAAAFLHRVLRASYVLPLGALIFQILPAL